MQPEIQSGDDAEVPAAAADCPVQVLVPAGPEFAHIAVSRHELCGDQVVARRSIQASAARVTAGEREARNAYGAARSHRRVEAGGQRGAKEVSDACSATDRGDSAVEVDGDGAECPRSICRAPSATPYPAKL